MCGGRQERADDPIALDINGGPRGGVCPHARCGESGDIGDTERSVAMVSAPTARREHAVGRLRHIHIFEREAFWIVPREYLPRPRRGAVGRSGLYLSHCVRRPVHRDHAPVRQLDEAAGKITLRHGPLKKLDMDEPMTMVFRVQDPAMLKQVKVGDKVKFDADRVNGQITVTKIQKAN